jgi:tetratricopeptide (TPR) repeat protein
LTDFHLTRNTLCPSHFQMEVFMKLKLYTYLLLSIAILVVSCKTATKLYEKGRYDEAVELAAKKLQKDPDDAKLLDVLQKSYRFAVDDHESRIAAHGNSSNDLKWEWIYGEYSDLQRLYEAIRKSPEVFHLIRPVDYSSYVVTYRERAGEVRFERGLTLMQNGDKASFRKAYRELQTAQSFLPGDLDIRNKLAEAYENAVVNVVVLPLKTRGGFQYSSFSGSYSRFNDNVMRFLKNNNSNEFIRYYSDFDAANTNLQPDYIVDVDFSGLNLGRIRDESNTRTVSKEVVVKETVHKPDSIVKEYAKVYARITTTTRSMRSEGYMQVEVRDGRNYPVWQSNYSGSHFWATTFSTFTGDSRALSEADKNLINDSREYPPSEDHIIRLIMGEIEGKVECGIRDHFYGY